MECFAVRVGLRLLLVNTQGTRQRVRCSVFDRRVAGLKGNRRGVGTDLLYLPLDRAGALNIELMGPSARCPLPHALAYKRILIENTVRAMVIVRCLAKEPFHHGVNMSHSFWVSRGNYWIRPTVDRGSRGPS